GRVIGVDQAPPPPEYAEWLSGVELVQADLTTGAGVIAALDADIVVHLGVVTAPDPAAGGRAAMKEQNVIGTMQLLAACQRSDSVCKLVVKSSTTVYGAGPNAPALFTEDMVPGTVARGGYEKDASEVEGYVRGFSRRRPDIDVTILRLANVVGPTIRTALSEYFLLPVVPIALGRDPRFQLVHEQDCLDVLRHATLGDYPGIFNVAGPDFLVLSQALRRAGRMVLPLPTLGTPLVGGLMRRTGLADMDSAQVRFLTYGRGVDTTRMREQLQFEPAFGTVAAFDDFVQARAGCGWLGPERIRSAERGLRDLLSAPAGREESVS
uniref:NAD-dependent epimerase/dehydratase family protein n=1 Tax=Haloactinopolyspora sp. TaxID=1966353 RepID=UPI00260B85F8